MRQLMKYLHEVGSYGLAGGFAAQLAFLSFGEGAGQEPVHLLGKWLVMPSFILCVLSAGLAIVARPTFLSKEWVWMKAVLTIPPFYTALATHPDILFYAKGTSGQLWVALVASLIVTAFSVWRPRRFILTR